MHRQAFRHGDYRMLTRKVGSKPWRAHHTGHGRGVDDMAAFAVAADVWNESTDAVKHTHKVHVENPSPIIERDVVDASSGADAGIVADHMDIAEGIERRLGGMLDVGRIGNVTGYAADIRPKLVQAVEGGRQSVLLDV